jgi:hypothetical protein
MDFEYENKTGRLDPNSPFVRGVPPPKRKFNSFASEPYAGDHSNGNEQQLTLGSSFGQPGTHSALESPSKNAFSTPSRFQLRKPANQSVYFSADKQLGAIPTHVQNSKAWEPRTPEPAIDFSSGGETPNTPAQDSDAATPDTQLASRMGGLSHDGERQSPKKSKSSRFLRRLLSGSPSPTKEDSRKAYSRKAENRIQKRRAKTAKTALYDDYESDNEHNASKGVPAHQAPPALGFAANIPGVLAWVEAHPNLPAVLSFYMQFLVNAALGLFFLWIIYACYAAVMNDIEREAGVAARTIMHDIAICTNEWQSNRCERDMRVPALEQACNQWELCMKQDAYRVARARTGARTFAMIFNAFVEEFSYKSMVFMSFFIPFLVICRHLVLHELVPTAVRGVERIQEAAVGHE